MPVVELGKDYGTADIRSKIVQLDRCNDVAEGIGSVHLGVLEIFE